MVQAPVRSDHAETIASIMTGERDGESGKAEDTLAPDAVVVVAGDGSARLLDMAGQFYAVSAIGAQMLLVTLDKGRAEAARTVAERYGVEVRRAERDLGIFLNDLQERGLIRHRGRRRTSLKPPIGISSILLVPALLLLHRLVRPLRLRAWALLTLAWLSCRCFGWARTIRAWQRLYRPQPVAAWPSSTWQEKVGVVDEVVRLAAARHILKVECKERALCGWSLLHAEGIPAAIVVGITLYPFSGHCWCRSGDRVVGDDGGRCEGFIPVIEYPADKCA